MHAVCISMHVSVARICCNHVPQSPWRHADELLLTVDGELRVEQADKEDVPACEAACRRRTAHRRLWDNLACCARLFCQGITWAQGCIQCLVSRVQDHCSAYLGGSVPK